MEQTDPRFRINAKQTAKGLWYFDATAEYKSDKIARSTSEADAGDTIGDTIVEPLGLRLLSMIKETEKAFSNDGRNVVGEEKDEKSNV